MPTNDSLLQPLTNKILNNLNRDDLELEVEEAIVEAIDNFGEVRGQKYVFGVPNQILSNVERVVRHYATGLIYSDLLEEPDKAQFQFALAARQWSRFNHAQQVLSQPLKIKPHS